MRDIKVTRPTQIKVDPNFPVSGKAQNITSAGDNTGTPWIEDIINDRSFGWQERILSIAGIVPNGNEENASQSQIADAIKILIKIESSGYNAVGSFRWGVVFTSDDDVGVYLGKAYKYVGGDSYPVTVPANTVDPSVASDYEEVIVATHNSFKDRNAVGAHNSTSISLQQGGSVQDAIQYVTPSMFPGGISEAASYARNNGVGFRVPYNSNAIELTEQLDLRGIRFIRCERNLDTSGVSVYPNVLLGGFASGGTCDWEFADITDGTSLFNPTKPTNPIVRIAGLKSSKVTIGSCNYLQLWADVGVASENSTAYNEIHCKGAIRHLGLQAASGFSWINENTFKYGRLQAVTIEYNDYRHNNNVFERPTLEGTNVDIQILGCESNRFKDCRLENVSSSSGITFDSGAVNNSLTREWSPTVSRTAYDTGLPVSDTGVNNVVTTTSYAYAKRDVICAIDGESALIGNSNFSMSVTDANIAPKTTFEGISGDLSITPSLGKIEVLSNRWIYLSGYIPVNRDDVFVFNMDTDTNIMRPYVFVYGERKNKLTAPSGDEYINSPLLSFNSSLSAYRPTANIGGELFACVQTEDVKYVRLAYLAGTAGNFNKLSIEKYTNVNNSRSIRDDRISGQLVIVGAPTDGWLQQRVMLLDKLNGNIYSNNETVDARLTSSYASGATSVNSSVSMVQNMKVGILLDDGTTHWTEKTDANGTNISLADPLPSSASSGSQIVGTTWELVGSLQ